ncbi:hypothetical protein GX51_05916 [Blastomyces parvus]|uniref:Uncharacterized protein n=1 Tax=Blastomyces parvus TaxID=2060905 RepID=A0A2B7WUE6_9EURO|nr:hypothetical protein GX51_05916 [Blastomyces parvus]
MAPRRGGGGGGSYFGGGTPSCSRYAFESGTAKVSLSYNVVYLVIGIVLLWVASRKLFKVKHGNKPPGRWLLILSLTLIVCAQAWFLVFLVLGQCTITSGRFNTKITLVATFLNVLAVSLLVGALMVSICKRLHEVANMAPRRIAMLHGLWAGAFAGFYFISACIYAAISTLQFEYSSSRSSYRALGGLIRGWNGVLTLAGVILLAGMASTAYTLLSAMSRGNLKTSSLRRYLPFLAVSCVGLGVTFLADLILTYRLFWAVRNSYIVSAGGYYALTFIYMLFYCLSSLLAVLVVASPAMTNNEPQGVTHEAFPQQQPSYAYPVQQNPPDANVPLMHQYPQQSYPPVPPVQPYNAHQQPQPPASYY